MTLDRLEKGQTARILHVGSEGMLRQHLLDMGILPSEEVTLVKYAPLGDPMEIRVQGYLLTLRKSDAQQIEIEWPIQENQQAEAEEDRLEFCVARQEMEHPGLGEDGPRYHTDDKSNKPDGTNLVFALVGNQNCGKTTLFNQLTGSNQHVGNFPGVTIDCKEGVVEAYPFVHVTDLPGIYSLSPYTNEEVVSRRFILEEKPSAIINIVDATNIERNLYLTLQLMELGYPMVLALNMMDEVESNSGTIRINRMERLLGVPVIPISAMRNEGVEELLKHAIHIARYKESPLRQDFCSSLDKGGAVHRCMHAIMHLIEDHAERCHIPVRFAASKLIEGDSLVEQALALDQNECEMVEHIVQQMEDECGMDRQTAIADMRFGYIRRLCKQTVVKPKTNKEYERSRRIDRVLTGRWTAIPSFVAIMCLVFYLTFSSVGAWLQEWAEMGIEWFTRQSDQMLTYWEIAPPIHSLIIDGIYNGVGNVLSFLPMIVCLFFFLSMLEDTGYMARIAFVMDKVLRKLGLSGRSIVPLLIGFGCSVPGTMASRTLPSARDRKLTIMLTPYMSCTAKIPVYAFLASAFFARHAAWVLIALYLLGIAIAVLLALVMKRTLFRGEAVPFVMELPNYRIPVAGNVFRLLWEKAQDFLQRAFTVIFLASIVIWFLQTFDFQLQMVDASTVGQSILARISSLLSPLFSPLGLGDWRIVTALISGLLAKEVVVSSLNTLYSDVPLTEVMSAVSAFCLMVFTLLYSPCMAAISTIRKELGGKWALAIVVVQCMVAWVVALLFHLLLSAL